VLLHPNYAMINTRHKITNGSGQIDLSSGQAPALVSQKVLSTSVVSSASPGRRSYFQADNGVLGTTHLGHTSALLDRVPPEWSTP
jgi:hypothetical protein